MGLSIIEALRTTSDSIANWARKKFATGLEVVDDKLYLKNSSGIIEDSAVTLPNSGASDFEGDIIFDCGSAPIGDENET